MKSKHEIKYAPIAVDDMDEIFSFISVDNVLAAEKMLKRLNEQISKLAHFPRMGSLLSDEEYTLIGHGYRFIVVQPYLVFYRIMDDHTIIIHRILHGRRDYLRELFTTQD